MEISTQQIDVTKAQGNFRIDSFLYIIFIWVSGELGEIDAGEKVLEVGGY